MQEPLDIRVVEGNDFTLILPLKKRTFVSSKPIDEPIIYADLQDAVLTIGSKEYQISLGLDGVSTYVEGLPRGTYDVILSATYHGAKIRAAYFQVLHSVAWNRNSNAEQFLPGSPITMDTAFIIGGPLTDEQLEELKAAYIAAKAAADQAAADAQTAKEAWEQKAEQLDDVAKQGSNPLATNTAILEAFGKIDFSGLAKETTSQEILTAVQSAPAIPLTDDQVEAIINHVINS